MRTLGCWVVVASWVVACGGDSRDSTGEQSETSAVAETPKRAGPEPLFNAEGELLESDQRVAGLAIPRGLTKVLEDDRRHLFHTRVSLAKVQQYFGRRLVTGQVDRRGEGAIFRQAVPSGTRGGVVKLDVSLLPMGRDRVRVEIVELPPPPKQVPSEAELRERLKRDMAHWD